MKTENNQGKVYSYIRFSDPRQRDGTSYSRQFDYARDYAKRHGMELDDNDPIFDEGMSAYHQRHLSNGELGLFLEEIKSGKIPTGSVLIVESWDRLNRGKPLDALVMVKQIVDNGISIVVANENKVYTNKNLAQTELLYAIIGLSTAHKESADKSDRIKKSIITNCKKWLNGDRSKPIRAGTDPKWVRWNGNSFELIEDRANAIRFVAKLYKEGYGLTKILKALDENNIRHHIGEGTLGSTTHLYKMIRSELMIGTKIINTTIEDEQGRVTPEKFVLENYYPRILSDEEYFEVQSCQDKRIRKPTFPNGKTLHPSFITGFGSTFCGYCGSPAVTQNLVRNRYGKKEEARRIRCDKYGRGEVCVQKCSCNMKPIEIAILNYCSDQINLNEITEASDKVTDLISKYKSIQRKLKEQQEKEDKIARDSLEDGGSILPAYKKLLIEIQGNIFNLTKESDELHAEINDLNKLKSISDASAWSSLAKRALDLDDEARMKVRKLMSDTFKRITVYFQDMPYNPESKTILVSLTSQNDNTRILRINKKTGEWVAGLDVNSRATK